MLQVELNALKTACSNCNLRELCLPVGLSREEIAGLDELVYVRRTIPRGDSLFRIGDAFHSLYAVRSGFFKTRVTTVDGRD
jgi:CRP/FNR family transcriptional regulator